MELNQTIIYSVPVGLVESVLDRVRLIGEVNDVLYQNASEIDTYYDFNYDTIRDEWTSVNLFISFYSEKEIGTTFIKYLDKYVDEERSKYNMLYKCWSIAE